MTHGACDKCNRSLHQAVVVNPCIRCLLEVVQALKPTKLRKYSDSVGTSRDRFPILTDLLHSVSEVHALLTSTSTGRVGGSVTAAAAAAAAGTGHGRAASGGLPLATGK